MSYVQQRVPSSEEEEEEVNPARRKRKGDYGIKQKK